MSEELRRLRAELVEQLELERMVARPPRKGYDLIQPKDDRTAEIEREIAIIDAELKALER